MLQFDFKSMYKIKRVIHSLGQPSCQNEDLFNGHSDLTCVKKLKSLVNGIVGFLKSLLKFLVDCLCITYFANFFNASRQNVAIFCCNTCPTHTHCSKSCMTWGIYKCDQLARFSFSLIRAYMLRCSLFKSYL